MQKIPSSFLQNASLDRFFQKYMIQRLDIQFYNTKNAMILHVSRSMRYKAITEIPKKKLVHFEKPKPIAN